MRGPLRRRPSGSSSPASTTFSNPMSIRSAGRFFAARYTGSVPSGSSTARRTNSATAPGTELKIGDRAVRTVGGPLQLIASR
ncbi:hypothetical protein NKH18_28970 [Streptomyces sp. M10(2022)]